MSGERVLLIVGGGVAAFKALELARLLRKRGIAVRPLLTRSGAQFVTPLSLSALCEDKVYQDLFSLTDEAEMGHIELSRSADLIVVVPATADLMAKAAAGLADDLASTTLLATDKPVLMAPRHERAHVEPPGHPAKPGAAEGRWRPLRGPDRRRHGLRRVRRRPAGGAGGDRRRGDGPAGAGRGPQPGSLPERPLKGRRVLVTAGPTREAIDPVRYLTNHSSGKQGYAIADALARFGAEVTLVSGPTALAVPSGVWRVDVQSACDMQAACEAALAGGRRRARGRRSRLAPRARRRPQAEKGPRRTRPSRSAWWETADILADPLRLPDLRRPRLVVGFAAETQDVEANARAKLAAQGLRLA